MDIDIDQTIIKNMCGIVSFKRGDSFYRANKVTFKSYSPDKCEAVVTGTEDFHVTVEKNDKDGFHTQCSCPTLPSFKNKCQHIAAVLLAVSKQKNSQAESNNQVLSEDLINLFTDRPARLSSKQFHFEERELVDAVFTCKPIHIGNGHYLIELEIQIEQTKVQHTRDFLGQAQGSTRSKGLPIFDPAIHCFEEETDAVIQKLTQVIVDEKVYVNGLSEESDLMFSNHSLLIPPSSWAQVAPLLIKAPSVKLAYHGNVYNGLHLSDSPLSLQFDVKESENTGFLLKIEGLNKMIVLDAYSCVLVDGKLIKLESSDCKRLFELKQMVNRSEADLIPISQDQAGLFIEKVVPSLKRLGNIRLPKEISNQFVETPLTAKLYLDRVKNRLLAGIEFHYGNSVINPLENSESFSQTVLFRDEEKESNILNLMEEISFGKTDGGYFLHNEMLEYEFLYHVLPKLQKLVQVYATTAVRNRISKAPAKPKVSVKVKRERTNWLEFKFEMDGIPEKHIREILEAIEEKRKYYRLRDGALLSLETKEFEEIKRFFNAVPVQDEDLENGLNLPIVQGLRLLDSTNGDNVFTFEDSFRQFLDSIRNPESIEFNIPNNLDHVLRDYQKDGYRWMKKLASYGFGGILADDMGLGKTLQSITFTLSELSLIREKKIPVLIVCPSSLTYNWLDEFSKFAPIVQASILDGNKQARIKLQKQIMNSDVVITSYPLLRADIKWFEKQSFHTVFFDEAQAFKNPVTQTARAVKKIQATNRFALTGTPVENSLEELWSIFHVIFPELFQGLKEYSNLSRKKIARRIRPFLLRRLKEDVLLELPKKSESTDSVELLPEQKKLYAAYLAKLRHDTLKHLDKDTLRKNRIKILAGLTRLRQICCHPALFVDGYQGSSAKFEQLMRIIEEARLSGRRVLIFSQFTKMLQLIGKQLSIQGLSFLYLDGQTPSKERLQISNRFNAGESNLFLISLKAGGTGLNLTGADTVILYDIWWNPAVEEQAADRAHRIGQTSEVHVIKLVARGTIEEKINILQDKKRHLVEEIINPDEKVPSSLTDDDIKEILMI
ncbi:SNF2 helicase associated domain-containing protein [Virgibacillus sp. DJP39]|uniref:SNF2 helicase associated domain-containing protein n=1 Tax=Virgibacillus sp. DJP39 TaxID=3409790 RepID=UPI003BB4EECA